MEINSHSYRKQKDKKQRLFGLIRVLNYYNLSSSIFLSVYLFLSLLFIFPFVIRVDMQNSNLSNYIDIATFTQQQFESVKQLLSPKPYSIILMIAIIMLFSALIILGVSLSSEDKDNNDKQVFINIKIKSFQILCFVILIFQIPLANYLTYIFQNNLSTNILISILAVFNFITTCIIVYHLQQYSVSVDLDNKFVFSKLYTNFDGLIAVSKLLINNIFLYFLPNQPSFAFFFILLAFIINLIDFYKIMYSQVFIRQISQQLFNIKVIIQFSFLVSSIAMFAFDTDILVKNLKMLRIVLFLFSYLTFQRFRKYRSNEILMRDIYSFKKESDAILYIKEIISISKISNYRDIFRPYFINLHFEICLNISCFCSKFSQYSIGNLIYQSNFLNFYILQNIQILRKQFPLSFVIFSLYLGFKILQKPFYSKTKKQIELFVGSHLNLSMNEQYLVYQLKKIINDQSKQINEVNNKMLLQRKFMQQSQDRKLKELLVSLVIYFAQKYKNLSLQIINLNIINQYCDKINQKVLQIQKMWKLFYQSNSFNTEFYFLFLFYFQNIMPSLEQKKQIIFSINTKIKKLITLTRVSNQNLNLFMYTDKCVILQSKAYQNIGVITNISSTCLEVFGKQKKKILNQHIHSIMPQFFVKGHKNCLQEWSKKQIFQIKNNDKMNQCLYVDQNSNCFSTQFKIKLFSDGNDVNFYVSIMKDNQQDYLVLSQNGRIEGLGSKIKKYMHLHEGHIHKNIQQIVLNFQLKQSAQLSNRQTIVIVPDGIQKMNEQLMLSNKIMTSGVQIQEKAILSLNAFQCTIRFQLYAVGNVSYYGIYFDYIRHVQIAKENDQLNISQIVHKNRIRPYSSRVIKEISLLQEKDQKKMESVSDNFKSFGLSKSNKFYQLIQVQNSIQNSTQGKDKSTYFAKIFLKLKQKFKNPSKINQPSIRRVTIAVILLSAMITTSSFLLQIMSTAGFISFNQVLFGDGAVSDNNQMFQIIYNNMQMARVYCQPNSSSIRCKYLLKNNAFMSTQLYNLYISDIQVFLKNTTFLSGIKYYQSYNLPANFTLNGKNLQITTLQFMQYFYQQLQQVQREGQKNNISSIQAGRAMQILFQNWNQMKQINHGAIIYYQKIGKEQLSILTMYLFIIFAGIVAIIIIFVLLLKKYSDYMQNKKQKILQIHSKINRKQAKTFAEYFLMLINSIKQQQYQTTYPQIEIEQSHQGTIRYQKQYSNLYLIVTFFLIVILLSAIQVVRIITIFPSAQAMVENINKLMDSQNYLLQNYFQLKTFYLGYNFSKTQAQINTQILSHLNQTEVQFNKVAKKAINMFSQNDPTFSADFNIMITQSVCKLTAHLFQDWQLQHCFNSTHYQILEKGVVTGMQFLQRETMTALIAMQNSSNINKTDYFLQEIFQDLDDYIFYMFRIYQATQARMYSALTYTIQQLTDGLTLINSLVAVLFSIGVTYWLIKVESDRKDISYLYGYVIQLPEKIVGQKNSINKLQQHIKFEL